MIINSIWSIKYWTYLFKVSNVISGSAPFITLLPMKDSGANTAVVESLTSGLPVVTTAVCGYGEHVANADAGVVLPEPFQAADFDRAVAQAPETLARWSANALAYAGRDELYSGLERAADIILADAAGR